MIELEDSLLVLGLDGWLYRVEFDPRNGFYPGEDWSIAQMRLEYWGAVYPVGVE